MLRAPNFDCVYRWRLEQEEKLVAQSRTVGTIMSPQQIERFIQFYQRLTEWGFSAVPPRTDTLFTLDADRGIQSVSSPRKEVRV
jgi:D-glycerate 3-kinase